MGVVTAVGVFLDRRSTRYVALSIFAVLCLVLLRGQSPLGWDEAVYAARAKDLSRSDFDWQFFSGAYWSDLRAPGFPVFLAIFFTFFGASDFSARLLVILFSVGLLWIIARILDLFGPQRVGTSAIIIASLSPGFVATSTIAFADHVGAFFALCGLYCFMAAWVRGPVQLLVLVPIMLSVATATRFGALFMVVIPLVIGFIAVILDAIRQHQIKQMGPYVLTALLSLFSVYLLLTTTFLTRSSSPIDASRAIAASSGKDSLDWVRDLRTILTPGGVDYGFNGPFWNWSFASLFALLLCVVIVGLLVVGRALQLLAAVLIALGPVVLYGVSSQQFVTTYLSPLFAIGVGVLAWGFWAVFGTQPAAYSEQHLTRWMRAWLLLAAAGVLLIGFQTFGAVEAMHDRLKGFEQVQRASIAARDILGQECRLFTARVPQASWYGECSVAGLPSGLIDGDSVVPWSELAASFRSEMNLEESVNAGLLLLEGIGGQMPVDSALRIVDAGDVTTFTPASGRRVLLIHVPNE